VARARGTLGHRRRNTDIRLAGHRCARAAPFIAGWAIATGVLQIVGAIRLRKKIENEWLLIASGVLSVIFGLILVAQPGTGVLALLYVIGIYAILYGILEIWLSLRLREYATS
jgi:uncharacterized membrane protein HdeD (DUF308 family)